MEFNDANTYYKGDLLATKTDAIALGTGKRLVRIISIHAFNPNAAISYIQFFDLTAANVTLGTTVPYFTIGIPANGAVLGLIGPHRFGINVCIAATTTATGNTAPGSAVQITLAYV